MKELRIGFIGQGWIGKNFANDFENRGYEIVRFALEEPYVQNKQKIKDCDIVFIAVPTPTTIKGGFSCEAVIDALTLVNKGAIAVIKSTIMPGTTARLQGLFPSLYVMHSPEFLVERTVKFNVENPERNIIGIPINDNLYQRKAHQVLQTLPSAPFEKIMAAEDAELVKYAGNTFLTAKLLFMNILYDLVVKNGGNWDEVREALIEDPRIGYSHTEPVFEGGRGAGGHCMIKDFEALRQRYSETVGKDEGKEVLDALTRLNITLLTSTKKSLDILSETFEFKIKD
jgi:nucleotide sugar dehydrogenase